MSDKVIRITSQQGFSPMFTQTMKNQVDLIY